MDCVTLRHDTQRSRACSGRTMSAGLNIAALAQRTGVPPDTLRKWEQRYQILQPDRTAGGQRRYSERDVARVRVAARAARRGLPHRRGGVAPRHGRRRAGADAARSSARDSRRRRARRDVGDRHAARPGVRAPRRRRDARRPSSARCSRRSVSAGQRGALTVAEEHLVSEAVRSRLGHLLGDPGGGVRGVAVLACAPGERHELGLMMAAIALRRDGWKVVYLGADTPLADAVALAAAARGADARHQPRARRAGGRARTGAREDGASRTASRSCSAAPARRARSPRRLGGRYAGPGSSRRGRDGSRAHGVACRHDPALHRRPLVARSRVRARGRGLDGDRRLAVLVALGERVPRARRAARRAERDARRRRRRGGRPCGDAAGAAADDRAALRPRPATCTTAGGHLLAKAPARTQFAPAPAEQASALHAANALQRRAFMTRNGGIVVVGAPLRTGPRVAVVAVSRRPDVAAAIGILNDQALRAGVIAGLIGVLVGLLLAQLIALRLRRLTSAAEAIAAGDFERSRALPLPRRVRRARAELRPDAPAAAALVPAHRGRARPAAHAARAAARGRRHGRRRARRAVRERGGAARARDAARRRRPAARAVGRRSRLREFAASLFDAGSSLAQAHVRPDEERALALVGIPAQPEGDTVLIVLDDLTEQERRELAEREFVSNAAHELRTPLTTIIGAVEVLQAGAKDDPRRARPLPHAHRARGRAAGAARARAADARARTRGAGARRGSRPSRSRACCRRWPTRRGPRRRRRRSRSSARRSSSRTSTAICWSRRCGTSPRTR